MRVCIRVLLSLAVLGILAVPVYATPEDPAAPPSDGPAPAPSPKPPMKPDPAKALFIGESLMPGTKDVPEGWDLEDDVASGGPTEEQLTALSDGLDLDEDTFYVQMQSFKKDGTLVTAAMVDIDKSVYAYKHALAAKAAECGWHVSDLGHPGRVLVLGGPSAAVGELKEKLFEHTIYALSEMAMNRLRNRAGHEDAGREAAITYTKYIGSLAPRTGTANAIIGLMHWILSRKDIKTKDDKPIRAEEEKAVDYFSKALADGVSFPPKGSVRVFAAGEMGGIILTWKDSSKLKQATRALEIAVEHEKDGKAMRRRHGNRYNLACAYARAKRIDDAFKMLEKSLELLKNMRVGEWRAQHKHADEKDEDMAPLRNDPRFSELMDRFKPPAQKKRKLPPGHPPVDDGK